MQFTVSECRRVSQMRTVNMPTLLLVYVEILVSIFV